MCMGGAKAPQVVYQGPSQEQIAAQQASLDQYRTQMNEQQNAFKSQLQQQIDAANAETATIRSRYEKELAASAATTAAPVSTANAQAATQQMGVYAVTASTSDAVPTGAQTTAAVTKKDKPNKSLKISTGGTKAAAGAGLNLGV